MHLSDLSRRNAAARPQLPAYLCGATTVTWLDVEVRSNRLARALLERGLRRGDRVALLAKNCHRYWEIHFACAKAGLVAVPLNSRLLAAEIEYIVRDAGCRGIFAGATHRDVVSEVLGRYPGMVAAIGFGESHGLESYEDVIADQSDASVPLVEISDRDISVIGYTSGTTGRPKGAMLTHRATMFGCVAHAAIRGLSVDTRWLAVMPAYVYRGGSGGFAPAVVGARTIVADFEAGEVLSLIERHRATDTLLAPAMLRMVQEHPDLPERDVSSLKKVWTGSAPIAPAQLHSLIAAFPGTTFGSVYGQTEVQVVTAHEHSVADATATRRLASAGRPTNFVDLKVVGPDGVPVDVGEVGEIQVAGETVMAGYWNDLARTRQVLVDGWLSTGDRGYQDEDGYLYLVDRNADVIISGGINVYSLEVENVIHDCPGVVECAVIGIPDDRWGEAVTAIVVGASGLTAEDVVTHCRTLLASFKKPQHVHFVEALPRSGIGKVDKSLLRSRFSDPPTR